MCSNGQFKWLWQKRNEMMKILCYFSLALILPMGYAWLGGLEERIIFPIGTFSLYYFQSHPLLCFPLVKKNHNVHVFLALDNTLLSSHCLMELSFFRTSPGNFLVECATFATTGPSPYFLQPAF